MGSRVGGDASEGGRLAFEEAGLSFRSGPLFTGRLLDERETAV